VALLTTDQAAMELAWREGLDVLAPWSARRTEALHQGARDLAALGSDGLLIVSSDLPLLGPSDLASIVAAWQGGAALVVAPDRHETSINALLLSRGVDVPLELGPGSLPACQAAVADKSSLCLVRSPSLGLDVDTSEDLQALCELFPDSDAARLVSG
jgi:2-phospho-L-lactate guanylyltransferase (CobY/MobA/RfbA family)